MEPKHGGRDLDNQARELDKAWREKRPPGGVGGVVANCGGAVGIRRRESTEVERVVGASRDMGETNEVGMINFSSYTYSGGNRCIQVGVRRRGTQRASQQRAQFPYRFRFLKLWKSSNGPQDVVVVVSLSLSFLSLSLSFLSLHPSFSRIFVP